MNSLPPPPPGFQLLEAPAPSRAPSAAGGDIPPPPPGFTLQPPMDAPAAASWTDTAADAAMSFGSGVTDGVIGLAGLPGALGDLAGQGVDYVGRKLVGAVTGDEPTPLSSLPGYRPNPLSGASIKGAAETVGVPFHEPTTTAGEYARTAGEFAPGAAIGPGGAVGKVAGDWLLPAVVSETAGQVTEGTDLEGVARVAGAIAGGAPAAVARMRTGGVDRAVSAAVRGVTPDEFDAAQRLQETANRIGVPLTGPEAIQAATNGATRLGDLQRVVEGSTAGGTATARFYAERPNHVTAAAGRAFDTIAPASPQPSTLGPRAADAATGAIRDLERARTAAVDPLFRAAAGDLVPEDAMRRLLADIDATMGADRTGILAGPLGELRDRLIAQPARPGSPATRTPVTGPDGRVVSYRTTPAVDATPAVPSTDIENLNRVRKYFRDRLDAPQIGQDAITKEQGAAVTAVLERIDEMMRAASSNYRAGNAEFARISDETVNPAAAGPLGRLAAAGDTAAATRAILPDAPLTGGTDELLSAIMQARAVDPEIVPALVRQALADQFDASAGRLVGGQNQYAGARFAKDVAGTAQQDANLAAVLEAIGRPEARVAIGDAVDVFRATGARKPQGSATAFNQQIQDELGALPLPATALAGVKTAGMAAAREIGDAAQRAWFGRNTSALADMFVSPDSVVRIRDVAGQPVRSPAVEMVIRQLLQNSAP